MVDQRRFNSDQQATPCIEWAGVKRDWGVETERERGPKTRIRAGEERGQDGQPRLARLGKAVEERYGVGNDRSARIGEATEGLNRNHLGTYPRHTVMTVCESVFR